MITEDRRNARLGVVLASATIGGCWEYTDFEICEKLNFLKSAHGDANIKNLKKIQKQGVDAFLAGKKYW